MLLVRDARRGSSVGVVHMHLGDVGYAAHPRHAHDSDTAAPALDASDIRCCQCRSRSVYRGVNKYSDLRRSGVILRITFIYYLN